MRQRVAAIVGVELPIARVEAKAKLSQNRTPEDVRGVIGGLGALLMRSLADQPDSPASVGSMEMDEPVEAVELVEPAGSTEPVGDGSTE